MRYSKIVGLVGIAVFALTGMLSAAAFALPSLLPETGLVMSGSGGEDKFVTLAGTEVKCTGMTMEAKFAAKSNLTPFHLSLTGCTSPTLAGAKRSEEHTSELQ